MPGKTKKKTAARPKTKTVKNAAPKLAKKKTARKPAKK
jgi:hypothetical protein